MLRRVLAALLVGTAVALLARAFLPAPATVPVVVARADLSLGTPLTAELLDVQPFPPGLVPPEAARSPDDLVGEIAGTSLPRGLPVTRSALLPTADLAIVRPGQVVLALPAVDPALARLVRPGDHLLALRGGTILARHLLVLATPGEAAPGGGSGTGAARVGGTTTGAIGGGSLLPATSTGAPTVLVVATSEQAQALGSVSSDAGLVLALEARRS